MDLLTIRELIQAIADFESRLVQAGRNVFKQRELAQEGTLLHERAMHAVTYLIAPWSQYQSRVQEVSARLAAIDESLKRGELADFRQLETHLDLLAHIFPALPPSVVPHSAAAPPVPKQGFEPPPAPPESVASGNLPESPSPAEPVLPAGPVVHLEVSRQTAGPPHLSSLEEDIQRMAKGELTANDLIEKASNKQRERMIPARIVPKRAARSHPAKPETPPAPPAQPASSGDPSEATVQIPVESSPPPGARKIKKQTTVRTTAAVAAATQTAPAPPITDAGEQTPPVFRPDPFETHLLSRIDAEDLATAFWLALGSGNRPVMAQVLKAAFLARHIMDTNDEPAQEYLNILYQYPSVLSTLQEEDGLSQGAAAALVALATLRTCLVAPGLGASTWLQDAQPFLGQLATVGDTILSLARKGLALDRQTAAAVGSAHQRRVELDRCNREARKWISDQVNNHVHYRPASKALERLGSEVTEVGRAMAVVAGDQREGLPLVAQVLEEQLADARSMADEIQRQLEQVSPVADKVFRSVVELMLRRLQEARGILVEWQRAAGTDEEDAERKTRLWQMLDVQLDRVADDADLISAPPSLTALLDRAVRRLLRRLKAEIATGSPPAQPEAWIRTFRRPLLSIESLALTSGEDLPKTLTTMQGEALMARCASGHDMRAAVQMHMQHGNFAAARLALEELPAGPDRNDLDTAMEDSRAEAEEAFHRQVAQMRSELERASVEHILLEGDRSDLEAQILSIERREESGYHNYGVLRNQLAAVRQQLEAARQQRSVRLRRVLDELVKVVNDRGGDLEEAAALAVRRAAEALDRNELALADEFLANLEDLIQTGRKIGADEPEAPPPDCLEQFKAALPELVRLLAEDARTSPKDRRLLTALVDGGSVGQLPSTAALVPERRVEIGRALDSWKQLLLRPDVRQDLNLQLLRVANILRILGFRSPEATRRNPQKSWWHFAVRMNDGGASPLPQLGSDRDHNYDLLVVWDRPNATALGQIIHEAELGDRCPIIFYMGSMGLRERDELATYCFRKQLTLLLLDEPLLCYLVSRSVDNPLAAWIACAMPWGFVNPYTPNASGNVPPEMFKGREQVIRTLVAPNGSAVIFGGRQLGKSAILRMIQRRYHDPEKLQYVFYSDLRTVGDPGSDVPTSAVWGRLKTWAVGEKLIHQRVLDQNVATELLKVVNKEPRMRIWILLDEADKFLDADSHKMFEVLSQLKGLSEDSSKRIKVILSGLHSVQRFSHVPNTLFAHLGPPINIKPLAPKEARSLVTVPLETVGFRFQSEDVLYRIFAYTNYHPQLIQEFCHHLLQHRRGTPPFVITVKTVEDVYGLPAVQRALRERFEYTVNLDTRYELLVYSMILEQVTARDGYRMTFSTEQALKAVAAWHKEQAARITVEEARALLDELVGLGVLVRLETGVYRLRNANVVRALGPDTVIMEQLDKAIRKPVTDEYDTRKLRAPLLEEAKSWSPLTLEQEALITRENVGLHLVFSTAGLGAAVLEAALSRLVMRGEDAPDSGGYLNVLPGCASTAELQQWLAENITAKDSGRFIIHLPGSQLMTFGDPAGVVSEMQSHLANRRSKMRSIHIVASFDEEETAAWFGQPEASRQAAEDRATSLAVSALWTPEMVSRYLNQHELLNSQDVSESVSRATGGWPWLIDRLHGMLVEAHPGQLSHQDPRQSAELLSRRLQEPTAPLGAEFLSAVGTARLPLSQPILKCVAAYEPDVTLSDLTPAFLGVEAAAQDVAATARAMVRMGLLSLTDKGIVCDGTVRRAMGL